MTKGAPQGKASGKGIKNIRFRDGVEKTTKPTHGDSSLFYF